MKRLWSTIVTGYGMRGFTLLEVMVSVGILGVIMILIWSSTSQSLKSKERIETRDLLFHTGQVALRKIADDVMVAFLSKAPTPTTGTGTTTTTTPTQAPATYKTFFIGQDRGDQDALKFTSLAHMRLVKNSKESDQLRVAYEVVPHPEENRLFNLVRRQQPWLTNQTEVEGRAYTLAEKILQFNVEYYDERKNDWGKEWDTDKVDWNNRLPLAVRITIVFADPDDPNVEIPLSTSVMPALWKNPISF